MKKYIYIFIFLLVFNSGTRCELTLQTIWGPVQVNHELLEKLIQNRTLQRLKSVDQSGPQPYFGYTPFFSRYDHSIGVLALLMRIQASLDQQVAGLLHDVSHTAFSHVGDHLFYQANQENSYQDLAHLGFLREMEIPPLTEKYGITLPRLNPDLEEYAALERPLPDLCADRIQYIIHTGVVWKKISQHEGKCMVENLQFQQGRWFFTDVKLALKFGELSLYFTRNLWGAEWNYALYVYFAELLKYAVQKEIIIKNDLLFGDDRSILSKLETSSDPFIQKHLKICKNIHPHYTIVNFSQGKWNTKPKFRGVDPLVQIGKNYKKLSAIHPGFKQKFEDMQQWCATGYGIVALEAN